MLDLPSTVLAPFASALASLPLIQVKLLPQVVIKEKLSKILPLLPLLLLLLLLLHLRLAQVGGGRLRPVHLDQVSTPELHFRLFRAEYVD